MPKFKLTQRLSPRTEVVLAGIVFLVFCYLFGFSIYRYGWYPVEEGLHLEMAERVQQGQLPHSDFDAPATGGLAYFHSLVLDGFANLLETEKWRKNKAGVWKIVVEAVGHSLLSPRIVLLGAAAAAFLLVLLILKRCLTVGACLGIIIAGYLWGPSIYLVSNPSWYGVLLAIVGCYFLLRYSETPTVGWLMASGAAAGFAFLAHQASGGLQFLAAVLFLSYLDTEPDEIAKTNEGSEEKEEEEGEADKAGSEGSLAFLYDTRIIKAIILWVPITLVVWILQIQDSASTLVYFASGPLLLAFSLLWFEWDCPQSRSRFLSLIKTFLIYFSAVFLVVLPYLIPFLARPGGLGALWSGVFIEPLKSIGLSESQLPGWNELLSPIPLTSFVLILYLLHREKGPRWTFALVVLTGIAGVTYSLINLEYFPWVWSMFRLLLPETILGGIVLLFLSRQGKLQWSPEYRKLLALLLVFATCFNLLQFPENSGITFLYAFPFLLLLMAVLIAPVISSQESESVDAKILWAFRVAAITWFTFIAAFAWTYNLNTNARYYARKWMPAGNWELLSIDRAPIFTTAEYARTYEGIVTVIQACSKPNDPILAFPDSAELYFLSGRRNPLRTYGIPRKKGSFWIGVVSTIEEHNMKVIVYSEGRDPLRLLPRQAELTEYLNENLPQLLRYPSVVDVSASLVSFSALEPWYEWEKNQPSFGYEKPLLTKKRWPWSKMKIVEDSENVIGIR